MIDCLNFTQSSTGRKRNRGEGFCKKSERNITQQKDCASCAARDSSMEMLAKAMRNVNMGLP